MQEYEEDNGLPVVEEFASLKTPQENDESLETIDKQLSNSSPFKTESSNPLGLTEEQPLEKLFHPEQGADDFLSPRLEEDGQKKSAERKTESKQLGAWGDSLEDIADPIQPAKPPNVQISGGLPSFSGVSSGQSPRNLTQMKQMMFSS